MKSSSTVITLLLTVMIFLCQVAVSASDTQVEHFGFHEAHFQASGDCANPFVDLQAKAVVTCPDGSQRSLSLFWDGGRTWKLRLSPDVPGTWSYKVRSRDAGLNDQQGSFSCVASTRRGSLQGKGHHFVTQDGTPFLFWGDTAWGLYLDQPTEELDRKAVFRYIDKRAHEGINVIHSMLLSEAGWGNSGGAPFMDMQAQVINPAYWQEVDARVSYLNQKGIIGGLVLAWGDKRKQEPYAWRMFPSLEARKRYARYIAARYGAYDVYFIIAGEWNAEVRTRDNTTYEAVKMEFIELGDVLAQADPHNRMIGIHPMTSDGSVRKFNDTAWMSFGDYQQNYQDVHGRLLASRSFNKPLVNSEYGYFLRDAAGNGKVDKHNSFTPEDMRFATWDILMAGAYPVTGYGTTYMGGYRDPGPFNPDDPRNDAWAMQYHLAQRFLTGLDWWRLKPMDDALHCSQARSEDREVRVRMSSTRSRTVRRPPEKTTWCLAEPGRHYLIYARGVAEQITLQLGAEAEYRLRLYNPRTGAMKPVGNRQQLSGSFAWTPPDAEDWVLHLYNSQAKVSHTHDQRPAYGSLAEPWTSPMLTLTETISLDTAQASPAERMRLAEGGRFVKGGWQPMKKLDRLIIELTEGFPWNECGAVELDMTNLDFNTQVNGKKQHFFNLYADPMGDQFSLRNAFFTLRGGRYKNDQGHRGIKVLWRGDAIRGEHAPYATRPIWNPQQTYTWRAEWNPDKLVVQLNGQRVFGPAEFGKRDRIRTLQHIFLSRDGCLAEKVWFGFPGPIYQEIRTYREVK